MKMRCGKIDKSDILVHGEPSLLVREIGDLRQFQFFHMSVPAAFEYHPVNFIIAIADAHLPERLAPAINVIHLY